MAETFFSELYNEAESGVVGTTVPKGTYDVTVADARPNVKGSQIWLDLTIDSGPDATKTVQVSLYFPKPGDKPGAHKFFVSKVNGFIAYPDVKAAFQAADNAPDLEAGFAHVASALIGKKVRVELGLQTEGQYKGNELGSTSSLGESPAQAAPAAAFAPDAFVSAAGNNSQGVDPF